MPWQAQKSLQSAGAGFSFFGGRDDKYQNAAELFIQAANAFKMQKQSAYPFEMNPAPREDNGATSLDGRLSKVRDWNADRRHRFLADMEAGKAFEQAAQIQTSKLNEPDDAANTLVDAFKAYRKDDPQAAVRCLNVAVDRYCAKGNFRRAASQKEIMGELYEQDLGDSKNALECYEAAAGWFEGDNANAYVTVAVILNATPSW